MDESHYFYRILIVVPLLKALVTLKTGENIFFLFRTRDKNISRTFTYFKEAAKIGTKIGDGARKNSCMGPIRVASVYFFLLFLFDKRLGNLAQKRSISQNVKIFSKVCLTLRKITIVIGNKFSCCDELRNAQLSVVNSTLIVYLSFLHILFFCIDKVLTLFRNCVIHLSPFFGK